jgi:Ca2+-binding RTX toxin-like protein
LDLTVTASDSSGETAEDSFQLSVSNSNDVPKITSANTVSVAENTTEVMTVAATDVDGDAVTFSISGGNDADRFATNSNTGEIIFTTSPDFENPTDSDTDNIYQVEVTADDGNTGVDIQTIQVRVTNINEKNTGDETADAGNEASGNENIGDGDETSGNETSNDSSEETADAGNETSSNENIGDGDENPGKETSNDSNNETPSEETSNNSGNDVTEGNDDKASDKTSDSDDTGNHPTNQTPSIDHIRLEPAVTADDGISLDKDVFAEVFSDAGGSELHAIRIDSLPENGILLLDREPVKAGQTISASELDSLVTEPNEGFAGTIEFDWNASNGDRFSLFGKTLEISVQPAEDSEDGPIEPPHAETTEDENQQVTPGNDEVTASHENNAIAALSGIDNIRGNGGNDTINGNQGEDHLDGGDGNDVIFGGQQADILNGGNGDDFLSGDLQEDTLTGGSGEDSFLLRDVVGADIITDFEDGTDSLVLPTSDFPLQPNGLTFEDLTIFQAEGGTVILVNKNPLAGLTGIDATTITEEDFQQVSSL